MPYIKVKIFSGDVYECIQTQHANYGNHKNRKKKVSKSTQKQILLNEKNAKRKITRLINANFGKGDEFLTLNYRGEVPSIKRAKKDLENFIRRVKYRMKKLKQAMLKYIGTTEYLEQRANHHIIMKAGLSLDILNEIWGKGGVTIRKLYSEDYTGLANYISKERRKEHSRSWTASRNLKKPIIEALVVKDGAAKVKEPKGYKTLEYSYTTTEDSYYHQYLKALRNGGADYANKFKGSGALDAGAVPKAHRTTSKRRKVRKQEN